VEGYSDNENMFEFIVDLNDKWNQSYNIINNKSKFVHEMFIVNIDNCVLSLLINF
jgi:hypothetical protein